MTGRQAYQRSLSWAYYYSNIKRTVDAANPDVLVSQVWCTYYDAADKEVGRFDCAPTTCANQGFVRPGEVFVREKCYRVESE